MNIGKIKVIFDRSRYYLQVLQLGMIGYLFLDKTGFSWWYLAIIPLLISWVHFDITHIMPKELDYMHGKSPFMRKILENVKEVSH